MKSHRTVDKCTRGNPVPRRNGAATYIARALAITLSVLAAATSGGAQTAQPATPVAPDTSRPVPRAEPARTTSDSATKGLELTPIAQTTLAAHPDGPRVGTLAPGARVAVTGRERGWVRVQIEAWARESDFTVADTSVRGAVSAADLRADPEGTVGRLVHWEVQILAHQVADPLRKGLAINEPYLLAQGPGREQALLYLAIPSSLATTARDIPDLARVTITARVRTGRSEPVGVPILELLTIVRR